MGEGWRLMTNENKNKITYLRFFMAFSIIWNHAYNVEVYNLQLKYGGGLYLFERFTNSITFVSLALFFALSGFLFYQNLSKDNIKRKLLSRIYSLIIPYIVWNITGFIYFQLLSLFPALRQYYGGQIETFSVSVLLNAIFNYKYNAPTWFLKTLIIYTYIMPIFYPAFKNKKIAIAFFIASILISCYGTLLGSSHLMNLSFYCLGMICGMHYKDLVLMKYDKKAKKYSLYIFILLMIINLYIRESFYGSIYYGGASVVFIRLLAIVCVWIFSDALAIKEKPKRWMNYSFVIYVSHEMVLEPIEKVILILLGNNVFGATIDYVFAPVLCMIIVCFGCFILEKMNLYKHFSGER